MFLLPILLKPSGRRHEMEAYNKKLPKYQIYLLLNTSNAQNSRYWRVAPSSLDLSFGGTFNFPIRGDNFCLVSEISGGIL